MSKHFKTSTDHVDPFDSLISDDPIADAMQVYGDFELDDPPDDCDLSPSGHHEFNCVIEPERCIHCGAKV